MITVVLGLAGALVYGFADFLGGLASRRLRAVTVAATAAAIGILPLAVGLAVFGGTWSREALLWGSAAGLSGCVGVLLLYAALAIGPMSVLSPVTAVFAAAVPVLVSVVRGTVLSPLAIVALVVALVAVVLVASVRDASGARLTLRGLVAAVVAGCGFGGIVLAYDATPADSGVVPLVVARVLQAVLLGTAAVVSGMVARRRTGGAVDAGPSADGGAGAGAGSGAGAGAGSGSGSGAVAGARRPAGAGRWPVRLVLVVVACGVSDALANVFIQAGLRSGDGPLTLPVMSVLNALYPIGTVVLAGVVLRERLTVVQGAGIALAVAASIGLALA
ncbi:EamA/RhaT family transporter [Curtobacterium sp. ISL-83]|uniref:EamA/RhaT family transporter n=1 Tax=Curtobacterium sp. ISL-83 TaxID=2819145 RepID=UPI001BEAB2F9|nr:EamA/RhaT family transporter [Curtobacterium sp. ISL-83]MBT2502795.1 EamA/RhaT family transporter [Curtobacterium sp. ISL-83]